MTKTIEFSDFMEKFKARASGQVEFHQAVGEVLKDLVPVVNDNPDYIDAKILERITEPERTISFRVVWEDDRHEIHVNRGYRVQFNSAIGPYKGGLRFHPTVNTSILNFLGFEQTFKNALTGLPMGGAKGGSDFDPRNRSGSDVMRFCNAFMLQLHRYIEPNVDIPAGDINVGSREIGYLFGAYRRITNEFKAALTGKGLTFGGSEMRTEATGYGLLYFVREMLGTREQTFEGRRVVVSGAGNVATHAAEKAIEMGARVVALSDSRGFILDEEGVTQTKIDWVRQHKAKTGASLKEYADEFDAKWYPGKTPWGVECSIALPCATQNEISKEDATTLINNGCMLIAEGANMPTTAAAQAVINDAEILFGPGKASNAGGVAVSGLEISQNRMRRSTSRTVLDGDLKSIMHNIHELCLRHGKDSNGKIDYARGANIAGFKKVAEAMLAQGHN